MIDMEERIGLSDGDAVPGDPEGNTELEIVNKVVVDIRLDTFGHMKV